MDIRKMSKVEMVAQVQAVLNAESSFTSIRPGIASGPWPATMPESGSMPGSVIDGPEAPQPWTKSRDAEMVSGHPRVSHIG